MLASIRPALRTLALLGMALAAMMGATFSPVATASAAGVAGKATLAHSGQSTSGAGLKVKLHEGASTDWLVISGGNLPSHTGVRLVLLFKNGHMRAIRGTRTGADGGISVTRAIGKYPRGTAFKVIAFADGGFKASSRELIVGP